MDETKKRDQNSVIIFYTLVLRRFFLTSLLAQLLYGNSEGDGAFASPTGAVRLFRFLGIEDWVTVVIYSSMFHQLLRKD